MRYKDDEELGNKNTVYPQKRLGGLLAKEYYKKMVKECYKSQLVRSIKLLGLS